MLGIVARCLSYNITIHASIFSIHCPSMCIYMCIYICTSTISLVSKINGPWKESRVSNDYRKFSHHRHRHYISQPTRVQQVNPCSNALMCLDRSTGSNSIDAAKATPRASIIAHILAKLLLCQLPTVDALMSFSATTTTLACHASAVAR